MSRTETDEGIVLVGEHDLPSPPDAVRSDVVLVHGFGEHRGRYGALVGELVAAGHACHRFDLRGHGDSGGRRGHVERFADYRSDLVAFVERAVGPLAAAGRPLVLLGHSLGGLIVLDTLLSHPALADLEVLSSPFLAAAFELPPLMRPFLAVARRVVPRVPLLRGPDPEGLSRDPAVVAAYRADPRVVRRLTPAWALETLAAQERVFEGAGRLATPTLMLLGAADPIADPARSRELFERLGRGLDESEGDRPGGGAGGEDKRLQVYDGMRHEVFNERGRERVVTDLLSWLDQHTPTTPVSPVNPMGPIRPTGPITDRAPG